MNTDLETIENYVMGHLSADERVQFETALRTDPTVAEALAFYMMAKHTARTEAREKRLAELDALRKQPSRFLWSVPMRWAAAASIVLLLGLGWVFFRPTDSAVMATRLTDEYIAQHFRLLPTTMDGGSSGSASADSVKIGTGLFNEGKLAQAAAVFTDVLARQPNMDSALKYAGIVSLRQGNYDQAIDQFNRLSQRTDLYSNPGLFYKSLALLKRGRPIDKSQAKKLLEEVIIKNLQGKKEAEKLVEQL